MTEEILINVTPQETRVAAVENGVLQELFIERANRQGLVGNIYKGRVARVLPGMQAAFIDVGLERTAFLHASDIETPTLPEDAESDAGPGRAVPAIQDLLRDGDEVFVQVLKDPLGTKGARLTTHISLPSRYLVFMPGSDHHGVSTRIEGDEERERLRTIVTQVSAERATGGGFIVRTAGEGATLDALRADMMFLKLLWESIQLKQKDAAAPSLVHGDVPLVLRIVRDLMRDGVERVRLDGEEAHAQVVEFVERFFPHFGTRVEFYESERPIFDLYSVEDEILKALERTVALKSGGHLVFDQTESMTTIDVNTGGFVGHRNLEETIFKTNLEAAQAIARQLRLRNLGGIIIIDFIDMQDEAHKTQVVQALEKYLQKDHARAHIHALSPLGLVEMTRKRTRESLEHILCEPCAACGGRGALRTPETISYEIFREILRSARQFEANELRVLAAPAVTECLLGDESRSLAELEAVLGKSIRVQEESMYPQDQYDVVLL